MILFLACCCCCCVGSSCSSRSCYCIGFSHSVVVTECRPKCNVLQQQHWRVVVLRTVLLLFLLLLHNYYSNCYNYFDSAPVTTIAATVLVTTGWYSSSSTSSSTATATTRIASFQHHLNYHYRPERQKRLLFAHHHTNIHSSCSSFYINNNYNCYDPRRLHVTATNTGPDPYHPHEHEVDDVEGKCDKKDDTTSNIANVVASKQKLLYEGIPKGFFVIKEYKYNSIGSFDSDISSDNNSSSVHIVSDDNNDNDSKLSTTTATTKSILNMMTEERRQKLLRTTTVEIHPSDNNNSNNSNNTATTSSKNWDSYYSFNNVTLPIALTIMDPITYPSLSRARKVCRKGNIIILRRQQQLQQDRIGDDDDDDASSSSSTTIDTTDNFMSIGRVGDRIYIGDIIGYQVRIYIPGTTSNDNNNDGNNTATVSFLPHSSTTTTTSSSYLTNIYHKKPAFDLPVIYQDNYYALVNKPAGVVCYKQGSGSDGLFSVRAMLPFVLYPPNNDECNTVYSILRRPTSVHRLDKPTSGLLCIVKTKPAMVHLSKQFHDRVVQKTYTAIINGIPDIESTTTGTSNTISSEQAMELYGIDTTSTTSHISHSVDDDNNNNATTTSNKNTTIMWNVIDVPIDNQNSITLWRVLRYVPSLRGNNGYITMIECKPKTGRYHQIRRHMAWTLHCPIVGDTIYDGGHPNAIALRGNGLLLCANRITHEHPYYNTVDGRIEWDTIMQQKNNDNTMDSNNNNENNNILWYCHNTNKVMISASIELPNKFHYIMQHEQERYHKFHDD